MNPLEVWLPVAEFPMYEISNQGRLRSWRIKKRSWRNPTSGKRDSPVVVSGTKTKHGYTAFILRGDNGGKPFRRLAHRLAAIAFIENPMNCADVAHNDGNPNNNNIENLRWATHRENQMDMRKHGTMQDGEKCLTSKITTEQAKEIQERAKKRGAGVLLSREFGLSRAQISRIKNGTRWAILGC